MANLTIRQQSFVREYLIHMNAEKAAIRAGYSREKAKEIGIKNIRNPNIAKAIQEAQESFLMR